MTFFLSARSRANLAGVHPDLIRIVEAAIIGVCFILAAALHREQVAETPKPQDKPMEQVEP